MASTCQALTRFKNPSKPETNSLQVSHSRSPPCAPHVGTCSSEVRRRAAAHPIALRRRQVLGGGRRSSRPLERLLAGPHLQYYHHIITINTTSNCPTPPTDTRLRARQPGSSFAENPLPGHGSCRQVGSRGSPLSPPTRSLRPLCHFYFLSLVITTSCCIPATLLRLRLHVAGRRPECKPVLTCTQCGLVVNLVILPS
jgi:hypothetical protein